jgi:apolipoprotein D and lipocalin family protein
MNMMKPTSFAFLAALLLLPSIGFADRFRDQSVPIASVSELDLGRYLGKWYEIARYPNWFERGCQGVTAEYSLRDDGKITVLNTCRKGAPDGPEKTAEGLAWVVAPGQLEVTFTPLLPFINGDYWVLHIEPDYSMAVVGAPKGSTGWVLARTPEIGEDAYARALAALAANGYDTARLEQVAH